MASHDTFGPNGVSLNRREVLTLTGAASAVATTQAFTNAASAAPEHTPHIVMDDALTLADTIRSRQVSCVEVMTNYLDHIERINPKVNAIVALQDRAGLLAQASERDAQLARGDLMGPLHGFPYAVKDLALVKGIRTTFGSPILKDFFPTTDSIVVERLRKAGAIFIGKTNAPEFGLGSHTSGLAPVASSRRRTSIGSNVQRAGSSSLPQPYCHFELQRGPSPDIAHSSVSCSECPSAQTGMEPISSDSAGRNSVSFV